MAIVGGWTLATAAAERREDGAGGTRLDAPALNQNRPELGIAARAARFVKISTADFLCFSSLQIMNNANNNTALKHFRLESPPCLARGVRLHDDENRLC